MPDTGATELPAADDLPRAPPTKICLLFVKMRTKAFPSWRQALAE
jgi:hypothetical protein